MKKFITLIVACAAIVALSGASASAGDHKQAATAVMQSRVERNASLAYAKETGVEMSLRDYTYDTECDFCTSQASTLDWECPDRSVQQAYLCVTTIRDPETPKPFTYVDAGISGYVEYDECGYGHGGGYGITIDPEQVEIGKGAFSVPDFGIECTVNPDEAPWEDSEYDNRYRTTYGDGYRYRGRSRGWTGRADTVGMEHDLGEQMFYVRDYLEHFESKGSSGFVGDQTGAGGKG